MKEFKLAIINVLKVQLICWALFMLVDECRLVSKGIAEQAALIIGALSLIGVIVLYIKYDRKIIKNNKLKPFKFNVFIYLFWGFLSLGIMYFCFMLIDYKLLHVCYSGGWSCFLNGIEYGIYGISLVGIDLLIIIVEIFILIVKWIIKCTNKEDDK